jgi:hypothetical protein
MKVTTTVRAGTDPIVVNNNTGLNTWTVSIS